MKNLLNLRILFFFFFLHCCPFQAKEFCYFYPPEGWVPAPPDALAPLVKVGFLEPKHFGFRSSLNLAEEEIDCDLDKYLEAVKAIHTSSRHNQWTYLGKFQTKAGPAALSQLDTTSAWGFIRMLQLIFVRENKAYILTAASSKSQFPKMMKTFKQCLGSFSITTDLLSSIESAKKREYLQNLQTLTLKDPSEDSLAKFQKEVLQNFGDLGAYWQALLIAETIQMRKSASQSVASAERLELNSKTASRP